MIVKVLEMLSLMKSGAEPPSAPRPPEKPLSQKLRKSKNLSINLKNSNGQPDYLNATEDTRSESKGPSPPAPNAPILRRTVHAKLGADAQARGNLQAQMRSSVGAEKTSLPKQVEKSGFLGNSVGQPFHTPMHQMQHLYGQNTYFPSSPGYLGPLGFGSNAGDVNPFYQMHGLRKMEPQLRRSDNAGLLPKPHQFCTEHQTVANMVCLTDLKVICSNCALFGVHKGHDYCKFEHFRENCARKAKALRAEMEKTEFKWYVQEGGREGDAIKLRVADKKKELFGEVDEAVDAALRRIEERREELKKEIGGKFRRFERIIDLRVSHHQDISAKVALFAQRLETCEAKLETGDLDFKAMFEVFFAKGPKNAFDELEKIGQEIEIEKSTNSTFVEKELARYKVEFEQAALGAFLKNQFVRLSCEIDSVRESLRNVTSLGNSYDRNFYGATPEQQKQRVMRVIKFDKDGSFEAKLAQDIAASKDIELMGSHFGSKVFSNINMSEFLKKNGPEQAPHGEPVYCGQEASFSKTERKREKKASGLEAGFSEKKEQGTRKIREEEIDRINNSSLTAPPVDEQEPPCKMMSFLEEENLLSASPPKSSRASPKKKPRITFEKEVPSSNSDLFNSAKKERPAPPEAPSDIGQFEQTESIIALLKRRNDSKKQLQTPKNAFFPENPGVLAELSLNRARGKSLASNAQLRSKVYDAPEGEQLNLYRRARGDSQFEGKRVKKTSQANFLGLESSENLYTDKAKKAAGRGRRMRRKATLSSSAVETQMRDAKKGGSKRKGDLRRRRGASKSKSINGMTSLLKYNKKSLRIKTDTSMLDKRWSD